MYSRNACYYSFRKPKTFHCSARDIQNSFSVVLYGFGIVLQGKNKNYIVQAFENKEFWKYLELRRLI